MEAASDEELEPSVETELPESDEVSELPDSPATPVPEEELVVLPVEGDALGMETDLRDLLRVRHSLPGATIVVEDRGLNEESRRLAEYLCRRYSGVELRPGAQEENA